MVWNSHQDHDHPPSSDAPTDPVPRRQLSPQLQKLVDHDDGFYDDVYSSYSVNSTDTPYRYAAYANRIRTLLLSAHRYVAYTSEVGESFRPVAHPYLVRTAYAISWTYLFGDVGHEGYKAYLRNRRALMPPGDAYKDAKDKDNELSQDQVLLGMATGNININSNSNSNSNSSGQGPSEYAEGSLMPWTNEGIPLIEDYRMVMAKRAVFQGLASMALPAFTIHSVVKYSGRMLKDSKRVFFRTWAPVGLGLSIVPLLPYIFDEPLDHAVDWSFRKTLLTYFGEDAVRPLPEAAHHDAASSSSPTLSHFLEKQNPDAVPISSAAQDMSWDEYREERRRAKEERMKEREHSGKDGLWGMVMGVVGGEKKKGD